MIMRNLPVSGLSRSSKQWVCDVTWPFFRGFLWGCFRTWSTQISRSLLGRKPIPHESDWIAREIPKGWETPKFAAEKGGISQATLKTLKKMTLLEKCPYSEFLWSVFSRIRTVYGETEVDQKTSRPVDSDSAQVETLLLVCRRFAIVRLSDNGPGWK